MSSEYWQINRQIQKIKIDHKLPDETCPIVNDIQEKLKDIVNLFEELRNDNASMRETAKEWYHLVDELHTKIGEQEDEITKKEKEISSLEDEIKILETSN